MRVVFLYLEMRYTVLIKIANAKLLSPETCAKGDLVFYGHLKNYLSA